MAVAVVVLSIEVPIYLYEEKAQKANLKKNNHACSTACVVAEPRFFHLAVMALLLDGKKQGSATTHAVLHA